MARVLIIDDDRSVGKILCKKIMRLGHDATWSDSLQKGVETSFFYSPNRPPKFWLIGGL